MWMFARDDSVYLSHHGILGQKWGIRRFQNPDGSYTNEGRIRYMKKGTRSNNLDKWGTERNNIILYITGPSGSGKSTKANDLAKNENAEIIHLDLYLEQVGKDSFKNESNRNFNKYLKQHGYDRNKYLQTLGKDKKEQFKMIDQLSKHIENYGKEIYGNKKLIVEGVQLADETMWPDKNYFKNKPFMTMNTSSLTSWYRAGKRDEKLNKEDLTLQDLKEYYEWYSQASKSRRALNKQLHLTHKEMG